MRREFDLSNSVNILKITGIIAFILVIFYLQPYRLTVIDSAEIGIKFHKWSTNEHQ